MSWHFYPEDRFSSYDEYVPYLKERGFAFEAPEGIHETEQNMETPKVQTTFSSEVERYCRELDARKEAWYSLSERDKELIYAPTKENIAGSVAEHFFKFALEKVKEEISRIKDIDMHNLNDEQRRGYELAMLSEFIEKISQL